MGVVNYFSAEPLSRDIRAGEVGPEELLAGLILW